MQKKLSRKTQHHFTVKALMKPGTEGMYLHNKDYI
jgi:hypothetical protein